MRCVDTYALIVECEAKEQPEGSEPGQPAFKQDCKVRLAPPATP